MRFKTFVLLMITLPMTFGTMMVMREFVRVIRMKENMGQLIIGAPIIVFCILQLTELWPALIRQLLSK